ncbi:MAG: hypothetical protein QOK47_1409 [Actinomycetota bacterium]|nr:hypothetical protein [Actinomycetota bacterium]
MTGSRQQPPRLVSVVIPTYNNAVTLPLQLEALARQTYQGAWEIVVSDNGSTDGTIEIAEDWVARLPQLTVVDASDRSGAAHARNVAVARSTGDLIVCTDADDIVADDWIESWVGAAARGDILGGALELRLLNDPVSKPWQPDRDTWLLRSPVHDFLPLVEGSNCAIWRTVLEALGGWDEDLHLGNEDVDLAWRAQLGSFELVHSEAPMVHYRHRSTLLGFAKQQFDRARSQVQLFAKFRSAGMPRMSTRIALLTWGSLVYRLPFLLWSSHWRRIWLLRAALVSGRLLGSLRWRVLYL